MFKVGAWVSAGVFLVALILFLIFRPWAFVDSYQLGYKYSALTGKITKLDRTGYFGVTPIVEKVNTVDLRPRQVCITVGYTGQTATSNSANRRVLNCKLVRFNPDGLDLFLSWHGRDTYEGSDFDDLLKIYAYDTQGRSYPFLIIEPSAQDQPRA